MKPKGAPVVLYGFAFIAVILLGQKLLTLAMDYGYVDHNIVNNLLSGKGAQK